MKPLSRILAVDDNELNIEILKEVLEEDFNLECAMSGEECLEIAARFRPDIILLDIMMPGIDGYEVCRRIRADSAFRRTKVIMVSAKAMVSERMAGYEAGANDYLTKPFEKAELLAKIHVFLDLKSTEEVREARLAGMAEVASGVLHNVGNVLNSINVSAERAAAGLSTPHAETLAQVADICSSHQSDFGTFVSEDDRGRVLPMLLKELCSEILQDRENALRELARLRKNIHHVRKIIQVQQGSARESGSWDEVAVEDLIGDAFQLACIPSQSTVQIGTDLAEVPAVWTDPNKAVQILVNLIKNAVEAVREIDKDLRQVTVRLLSMDDNRVQIEVRDNGVGIRPEDTSRIFAHGFTTKSDGHGFGLHSSALAARSIGGSLRAHSEGPGRGSTLTLELPIGSATSQAA